MSSSQAPAKKAPAAAKPKAAPKAKAASTSTAAKGKKKAAPLEEIDTNELASDDEVRPSPRRVSPVERLSR